MKEMVAIDSHFLHLVRSRRLLSKFQGPFRSTHSIWHIEVNLNCRMFCPTSTIRRSEPIFQANQSVLFRARRFWCRSASSRPNKLHAHSSSRSDFLIVEIVMSSSSSLVSLRCWMPSKIDARGKVDKNWRVEHAVHIQNGIIVLSTSVMERG